MKDSKAQRTYSMVRNSAKSKGKAEDICVDGARLNICDEAIGSVSSYLISVDDNSAFVVNSEISINEERYLVLEVCNDGYRLKVTPIYGKGEVAINLLNGSDSLFQLSGDDNSEESIVEYTPVADGLSENGAQHWMKYMISAVDEGLNINTNGEETWFTDKDGRRMEYECRAHPAALEAKNYVIETKDGDGNEYEIRFTGHCSPEIEKSASAALKSESSGVHIILDGYVSEEHCVIGEYIRKNPKARAYQENGVLVIEHGESKGFYSSYDKTIKWFDGNAKEIDLPEIDLTMHNSHKMGYVDG